MLKKSLFLLCLYANFSYAGDVTIFNVEQFEADMHTPQFEATLSGNTWNLYVKNMMLTEFAIRLIEMEKHCSKEESSKYQSELVAWLTRSASRAKGRKAPELSGPLEKELLDRKFELEQANLKRQSPPNRLAFLCLVI